MADLGSATFHLNLDDEELARGLVTNRDRVRGFATTLRGAGIEVQNFGRQILGAVAGVTGAFIDFESAMAGVRKTVDPTEEEFAILIQGIRDLAKVIPVTTTELARIMTIAGQLGVRGSENLLTFTRTIADITATTDLAAESAAFAFARISAVTGEPIENIGRMASTVVDLGNNFAATEPMIVDLALRLSGLSNIAGLATHEILGLAAGMRAVGVTSELGGTTATRVFLEMREAISDGGDQLKAFSDLTGLTAEQFETMFGEDPAELFLLLAGGIGAAAKAGKDVSALFKDLELSNLRSIQVLSLVGGGIDLVRDAVVRSEQAWEDNTALTREASIRYETLASQIQVFKNRLNDLAITLGGTLAPMLTDLIKNVTPIVEKIGDFIAAHPTLMANILALTVALGLLAVTLGTVAVTIAVVVTIAGVATGVFGLLALALVAIALGAALIIINWGKIEPVLGRVLDFIKAKLDLLIAGLMTLPMLLIIPFSVLPITIAAILRLLGVSLQDIIDLGKNVRDALVGAFHSVVGAAEDAFAFIKTIPSIVEGAFNQVVTFIEGIWTSVTTFISNTAIAAWEGIKTGFTAFLDFLVNTITAYNLGVAIGFILTLPFRMLGEWLLLAKRGVELFIDALGLIWQAVEDAAQGVWNFLMGTKDSIVSSGPDIVSAALSLGESIIKGVWDGMKFAWHWLVEIFTFNLPQFIVEQAILMAPTAFQYGLDLINKIWDGVKSLWTWLFEEAQKIALNIVTGLEAKLPEFWQFGRDLASAIWDGIKSIKDWLIGQLTSFAEGLLDAIKDGLGPLAEFLSPKSRFGVMIGEGIGLGILSGLEGMNPVIRAAMKGLEGDMSFSPNVFANGVREGTGRPITVNVQIGNVNARDDTEARKVAERISVLAANRLRGIVT